MKKIHDVIRSALNQAMKWNYLDPMMQNPAKLATLPTMKKTKRKVWSVSTFREALPRVEDDILALAMNSLFLFAQGGEINRSHMGLHFHRRGIY